MLSVRGDPLPFSSSGVPRVGIPRDDSRSNSADRLRVRRLYYHTRTNGRRQDGTGEIERERLR